MEDTFKHLPNMGDTPSDPGPFPHIALSNRIQHHYIKNSLSFKMGGDGVVFHKKTKCLLPP